MSSLSDALAQAVAQIEAKVDAALADDVANVVKDRESKAVDEVVYSSYTPLMYSRRGDYMEGLGDIYNMESTVLGGVLSVSNVTPPADGEGYTTGKNLAELVEYGNGHGGFYDFPKDGSWRKYKGPRPFTKRTREMLRSDKSHVAALKAGLKKRGLKVE